MGKRAEEPEGAWCQRSAARDRRGRSVKPESDAAVCWCAMGAINRVVGDGLSFDIYAARFALRETIRVQYIAGWNDDKTRTQAEVVTALRNAAAMAVQS